MILFGFSAEAEHHRQEGDTGAAPPQTNTRFTRQRRLKLEISGKTSGREPVQPGPFLPDGPVAAENPFDGEQRAVGLDQDQQDTVNRDLMREPAPQTGRLAAFRRAWYGRILAQSDHQVVAIPCLRLPFRRRVSSKAPVEGSI